MGVVSDAGPLNYLILVGAIEILPQLFETVALPWEVAGELRAPGAPLLVRDWMRHPPSWAAIPKEPLALYEDATLDAGERAVIALGLSRKAELLLMDDRKGVVAARKLGLATVGTIGLIDRAARRGLLDLNAAVERLRETNFRASPQLFA